MKSPAGLCIHITTDDINESSFSQGGPNGSGPWPTAISESRPGDGDLVVNGSSLSRRPGGVGRTSELTCMLSPREGLSLVKERLRGDSLVPSDAGFNR